MKIQYRDFKFRAETQSIIDKANEIIATFEKKGYSLTLRQLYYQFVSEALIVNTERSYKRLGSIINDGRLAGEIDWLAIEDRTRSLKGRYGYTDPGACIEECADDYHMDMWAVQKHRVEVWVEKDALIDVVRKACGPLDVDHFSCRGYVSQSAMHSAARRLSRYERNYDQLTTILHLGDHDPSGIDMTRDIQARLSEFGSAVTVVRIALTMKQINQFKPPPNPAKITDSRAKEYIKKWGNKSWELDALSPEYMTQLIEDFIRPFINAKVWGKRLTEIQKGKKLLTKMAKNWKRYKA